VKKLNFNVIERNFNIDETTGLRTDEIIQLNGYQTSKHYPEKLRLVEYYDDEKEVLLVFITNNFEVSALEIPFPSELSVFSNRASFN